jgi:ribosomal protein L37AE/L43A
MPEGIAEMAKKTNAELACSFCGKPGAAVKLIAGPSILICAECVARSLEIAREGEGGMQSTAGLTEVPDGGATYSWMYSYSPKVSAKRREEPACSFCGEQERDLVQPPSTIGAHALICSKCLQLCQEVIKQDQAVFDQAFTAVREIVDMPDRRASLFVRLCMQNGGRLSAAERPQFPELSDAEISQLGSRVRQALYAGTAEHP